MLDVDLAELAALGQGLPDDLVQVLEGELRPRRRLAGQGAAQQGRGRGQRDAALQAELQELAPGDVFDGKELVCHGPHLRTIFEIGPIMGQGIITRRRRDFYISEVDKTLTTFLPAVLTLVSASEVPMWRKKAAFLFILTLTSGLLSPGCATLTRGRERWIPVTSYPPGAKVIVNGRLQGETPLTLRPVSRRKGQVIRIECAGYDPVEIRLIKKTSGGYFFGNLLLGLIPAMVPATAQSLAHEGEGVLPIWVLSAAAFGALFTLVRQRQRRKQRVQADGDHRGAEEDRRAVPG